LCVPISLKYAARHTETVTETSPELNRINILASQAQQSHPASDLLHPPGDLKHDHMEPVCSIDLQTHTINQTSNQFQPFTTARTSP